MARLGNVAFVFCCVICVVPFAMGYAELEFDYSRNRDWLKQQEDIFRGGHPTLNRDEEIVDHFLQYLKWSEYMDTKETGFPPSHPIENQMEHITSSKLFEVLKKLPKGAHLHTHENHELNKRTLLELVWHSDDFEHLFITSAESEEPWILDFFVTPPDDGGWINVKDSALTIDDVMKHVTLINVLSDEAKNNPTDSSLRWRDMDPLWSRAGKKILSNVNIFRKHLRAMYKQCLEEGLQFIETRKGFSSSSNLYKLDPEKGKVYLDNQNGALTVNVTLEVLAEFQEEHPEFIGHKRIANSVRFLGVDRIKSYMDAASALHNMFPNHVAGFDLVSEEDNGNSLLYFLKPILDIYRTETEMTDLPLYLHNVETNWPDDIITSLNIDDPVACLENLYEAIMLGAKRLGHGLGLYKHPYLMDVIKKKDVAIEICPVSNQLLGFVPDLRSHPGQTYFRSGIPIVIAADDPGTLGHNHITVDWYEIYMAWGLDLADLKTLANNSIQYSSMTDKEKVVAMNDKWAPAWKKYIDTTAQEACKTDFKQVDPHFSSILPKVGPYSEPTLVHIFGHNFERAVCKEITCYFGEWNSAKAKYINNAHILCEAPDADLVGMVVDEDAEVTVPVRVDLGDGLIKDVGQNFTYKHDPKHMPIFPVSAASCLLTTLVTGLTPLLILFFRI